MTGEPMAGRQRRRGRPRRILQALYSPDSYAPVLLLIVATYATSAMITADWAASVVLTIQIGTVWVTLRASGARRRQRLIVGAIVAVSALGAVAGLVAAPRLPATGIAAGVSGLLYLVAPFAIIRHLISRRIVDVETLLGAVAAYLMIGIFFAFAYRSLGILQEGSFFDGSGDGTLSQTLFFSFTTLTTTGYGNLVPAGNPGQTLAVLEMVVGQLFLVTAVAKVVSSWQPGSGRTGLRAGGEPD